MHETKDFHMVRSCQFVCLPAYLPHHLVNLNEIRYDQCTLQVICNTQIWFELVH